MKSLGCDRFNPSSRAWVARAVNLIEAEGQRSADTHLVRFLMPHSSEVSLYLKDESTHPSGSLKHRLARSLFLYALCNGWITEGTTVVEASSGSTAVSEAYFAQLIGVPFIAVVPEGTSPQKLDLIERNGGRCHLVADPSSAYQVAREIAQTHGGHYMDQFTHAERATDWRGNNNIAESIFRQMRMERHPVPEWIVTAAGTGGTSATIGRYLRYRGYPTRLCVPDPVGSAFFEAWVRGAPDHRTTGSRIEGIGRPQVEPSFIGGVVDRMVQVPDEFSIATMHAVEMVLGRQVGPSTGTNLWAAFQLMAEMERAGTAGSIVTIVCDGGERYQDSYYNDTWLAQEELDLTEPLRTVHRFLETGEISIPPD